MNSTSKIAIVVTLVVVVGIVLATKQRSGAPGNQSAVTPAEPSEAPPPELDKVAGTPRLLDLGSVTCIPCKMMAPMLEELRKEYAGRLQVEFVDVNQDREAAAAHGVRIIPTQIFFDASGKEVFRHEGFFGKEDILAKWRELGVDLKAEEPSDFQRMEPAQPDTRPKDAICYMCDGDIDAKTLVNVQTEKGGVRLCSPHCYFIMYSCLTQDKTDFEKKVRMTDYDSGKLVPATQAVFLRGLAAQSDRPWIKAFTEKVAAQKERQAAGGNVVSFGVLQRHELSHRCGFCDRACYPQDAAGVNAGGVHTYGCCSHCAIGVAARTGLDIEVHQPDRLTGEMIVVRTVNGSIASLEPKTALAWFGMRRRPNGKWGSAGCFHQGFFANEANLRKWVEANPYETGRQITIHKALADKMKMTPQQISKACKIGECAPK